MKKIVINNFPCDCRIVLHTGYTNVLAIAFTEQKIIGVREDSIDFSRPSPPPVKVTLMEKKPGDPGHRQYSYAVIGRKDRPTYIGINHIPIKTSIRTIIQKAIKSSKPNGFKRWCIQELLFWKVKLLTWKHGHSYPNVLMLFVPHGIEIECKAIVCKAPKA